MKFVFAYHGGVMPETEAEQKATMEAWGAWMGGLGKALVDMGNPIGQSATLGSDGAPTDNSNPLTGYSLVEAADMDAAVEMAKGCPVLASGGTVEIGQTFEIEM